MKLIIIEDEKPSARMLQRKVENLGYEVEKILHSVEEGIEYFKQHEFPELILADIQLSDGLSFEIFDTFDVNSSIIFTTAYDEYALKAFKLNSIDYLLKPIDTAELKNALEKYKTQQQRLDQTIFRNIYPDQKEYKKRFIFKIGQSIKVIEIGEVECIYSENKGTYFYTNSGKNYLYDQSLESVYDLLDPKAFFRINRQQIIALSAIEEIKVFQNTRLKLGLSTYKEETIVSRERVQDFKKWIE